VTEVYLINSIEQLGKPRPFNKHFGLMQFASQFIQKEGKIVPQPMSILVSVKNGKNKSSTDAITDISKNRGSKIYKSNEEKTYEEEEVENINDVEKNEKKRGYC